MTIVSVGRCSDGFVFLSGTGFEFGHSTLAFSTLRSLMSPMGYSAGRHCAIAVALSLGCALIACSESEDAAEEPRRTIALESDQELVVPTSEIEIRLLGSDRIEAEQVQISVVGEMQGRTIDEEFSAAPERDGDIGDLQVSLSASDELWPRLEPGDGARFQGALSVEMEDVVGISTVGHLDDVSWRFVEELAPDLAFDAPSQIFANAAIDVTGSGILRAGEGQTVAVIDDGQLEAERGHTIDLSGETLPVEWSGDREAGQVRLDPAVVGVHPGALEITLRFENRFADGAVVKGDSDARQWSADMDTTFVASVAPKAASRGQLVELHGRGFVPRSSSDNIGMLLRFEGTLMPSDPDREVRRFEGASALEHPPYEVTSGELIRQDLWYRVVDRRLEGLAATPGVFEGTITPVVYDEYGELEGIGWEGSFEILSTRQVVYLKYLPAFSVALDRYGLANVEREIRDRILEVVHRDYDGINIEFVDRRPDHFADYATIEMSGPDPTGNYAFGFDNTYHDQPKDTGNLHIDDILGGINPDTGQEYNNPYGGIFVESIARFSPTLHPEMGHASKRFDDIFGPFMDELGGRPVRATEWPDGDRSPRIAEAIRVFGNLVGNTVSHEMGHALGLAHFEGDWEEPGHRFHNVGGGGYIMDAGSERSFEHRGEVDGAGPGSFNAVNRAYLEQILPVE